MISHRRQSDVDAGREKVTAELHEFTLPEVDKLMNFLSQFDRDMTLSEFLDALLDYRQLVELTRT